jgi:hypothetical protein
LFWKRNPTQKVRRYFLDELRTARAQAQKNTEDFAGLLIAFERLGAYLAVDDDGAIARERPGGLGEYELALGQLAQYSVLGDGSIEDGSRRWHSSFETLFGLVKDARNSALHEGAKARHLTEHAIELAHVFEEALRRMPDELATVGDLMVRSVVVAETWQPISFVRQAMLTNSFSYLPLFIGEQWKLFSDNFVARYLQKAASKAERRAFTAKCIAKAVEESPELPLPDAWTAKDTDPINDLFKPSPKGEGIVLDAGLILVLDSGRATQSGQHDECQVRDLLVGVITAFDLL